MAFDFNFLSRHGGTTPAPAIYTYLTSDTRFQVLAVGYFNQGFTNLKKDDFIDVVTPNTEFKVIVTAIVGQVVTVRESMGATDFFVEVAKGNVPGHALFTLVARNPAVGNTEEDIWGVGGKLVYPLIGEQWELVSDSTNDTSAGTGARSVNVFYLDDNYVRQEEIVILNGTSAVAMVATNAFRTRTIAVATAGSGDENDGDITLQVVSGGNPRNRALAGKNNDQDCHYTVPAGVTAFPIFIYEEINKNEDIVIEYQITDGTSQIFRTLFLSSIYQNTNPVPFAAPPIPLLEKSDVRIRAVSSNLAAAPSIIVQFLEVDNT